MTFNKYYFTLVLIFITHSSFSQFTYTAELNVKGLTSFEKEKLPFWMSHNQRGRISEDTNFAGWFTGKTAYSFQNNSILEMGGGILYQDGDSKDFFTEELYIHYETYSWRLTAGKKHQPELYNGLSASNRSILWSLNTRAIPGVQAGTIRPIFFLKNWGFEANWAEYLLEKDRYVKNALLHHKSLHLIYSTEDRSLRVKAGLQHFAQWGGTSPVKGDQPQSFRDYLRVITGQGGGDDATAGDQLNVLGNHLGGYELYINKTFPDFHLEILYNHLFEDGSGRRLGNTPDGRYGIFFSFKDPAKIINSLMYEFYYTEHQSHTTSGNDKNDSYFSHGMYRSGWTYYSRILGVPFFKPGSGGTGIAVNRFRAHHLGFGGRFPIKSQNLPYKLLLTYVRNQGNYYVTLDPKQHLFYTLVDINLIKKDLDVNLQIGSEFDSYKAPNYGIGLNIKYKL